MCLNAFVPNIFVHEIEMSAFFASDEYKVACLLFLCCDILCFEISVWSLSIQLIMIVLMNVT